MTQKTMNVKTAASELGKSYDTICRWIKSGKLAAKKDIFGSWYIDAASVQAAKEVK